MGALAAGRRAPAGLGGALLGLLVLLSCCQLAAAQNYTALRDGVWLPPQGKIDNVTEAKEYDGLVEKLPQIKGKRAEQQLQLLSAGSRSKLNNLTGNAAEWLKNRTDIELEELFENVRAENFRRMMAMAAIGTQLRNAFTSSNVLRSLELLQTEDLERLASLPLFEERYQRLTNVTFLELMRKLYDFGMTQVTQRTCVMTAANTSSISRLPNADQYPTSVETSTTSFAAIKLDPSAVTRYSILQSGRRRSSSHRRSLLEIFADTASTWLRLDHEEAAAAVVREVTAGPGTGPGQMRKMLYTPQSVEGTAATPAERTVAPIVTTFLDSLTPITGADGVQTYHNPDPNQDPTALLSSAGGVPGLSTQPGFLDSRVVSRGCSENLGVFRVRPSSIGAMASATSARGSVSPSSTSNRTAAPSVTQLNKTVNALVAPANCTTQGLISNGTACVPCPTGAVLDGAACICGNGTSWSAAVNACITSTATPNTLSPCSTGNGTATNGTVCSGGTSSNQPLVNITTIATPNSLSPNVTATAPPAAGVVNVSLVDPAAGVLNSTVLAPEVLAPVALNATALPSAPVAVLPPAGSGNDTVVAPQVLDPSTPLPPPAANASAPAPPAVTAPEVLPTPTPAADPVNVSTSVLPASGNILPALETAAASPAPAAVTPSPSPAPEGIAVIGNTILPAAGVIDPSTLAVSPSPAVTDPAAVVPSPPPSDVTNGAGTGALVNPATQPVPSPAVAAGVTVVNPANVLPPTDAAVPSPAVPVVPSPPVVAPVVQPLVQQPVVEQPVVATPVPAPVPVPTPVPAVPVTPVVQPSVQVELPPPPPPVACVGQWIETGVCNAPCEKTGTKTSTYQIITPAANGGAPCEAAAGAAKEVPCISTEVCPKAPPINCVGSWAETAPCDAKCESAGSSTQTYTVITPAANGGAQCEAASGQTKQVPCSNPTPCPKPPVNCVGSWAETGTCNAKCESAGTKTSVYTVTTPAANGGAPCEAASGQTREVPCSNPEPCPKPQIAPVTAPVVPPPPTPVTPPPAVVPPTVVQPAVVTPAAGAPKVEQVATAGALPL